METAHEGQHRARTLSIEPVLKACPACDQFISAVRAAQNAYQQVAGIQPGEVATALLTLAFVMIEPEDIDCTP